MDTDMELITPSCDESNEVVLLKDLNQKYVKEIKDLVDANPECLLQPAWDRYQQNLAKIKPAGTPQSDTGSQSLQKFEQKLRQRHLLFTADFKDWLKGAIAAKEQKRHNYINLRKRKLSDILATSNKEFKKHVDAITEDKSEEPM